MQFTKMHGLENDYIYIDTFQEQVANPAALARAVSDRHAGIGSDGLILIGPADAHANADVRMRIFNADGGEAQMCGNGIRCVAKFVVERKLTTRNPVRVQTGRGTLAVSWRADAQARVHEVAVDMGLPIVEIQHIPAIIEGFSARDHIVGVALPASWWDARIDSQWKQACRYDGKLSLVSMGNPHAILWCDNVSKVPLEIVGPWLERHRAFPERMNIHFAQRDGAERVQVRTWERGSGMTRACGTGACAVVVAGVLGNKLSCECHVVLPGGALHVRWPGLDQPVIMTGPAVEVCRGELSNELLQKAI